MAERSKILGSNSCYYNDIKLFKTQIMTTNPTDMKQDEHDDNSGTLRGLMFGQTTSGETIELKVNDNGSFK